MDQLPWMLTFMALALWATMSFDLVHRPPEVPGGLALPLRRTVWALVSVSALVAGVWGPELWSGTETDHSRDPDVGQPVERVSTVLRTPFAVRTIATEFDGGGRRILTERRLSLQLPVALLGYLAVMLWWRTGPRGGAPTVSAGPSRSPVRGREPRHPGADLLAWTGLLCATLGASACGGGASETYVADRPVRTFTDVTWDTLAHVRTEPDDTLLFSPGAVVADDGGFWVADGLGYRVARFDWSGALVRYVGRVGSGPGEFRSLQALDVDGEGRLWVLDTGNARISAFDADGALVDEVPVRDFDLTPHAFAVSRDGDSFFLMSASDVLEPQVLNPSGRVERGSDIPVEDAEGAYSFALQGTIARARESDDWVYAFTMGDGLYRMRGAELVGRRVHYPEAVPFPRMVETVSQEGNVTTRQQRLTEPSFSAGEMAVVDGVVSVRFRGETPDAGRLLDRYDLDTGAYLDTWRLPMLGRYGAWDDKVVLVGRDPTPEILVIRRVE